MELSSNFQFDFSDILTSPMQQELLNEYDLFLKNIATGRIYYDNLKLFVTDILEENNNPPSVENVDVLNADLGMLLVALEEGGLNLGNLGSVTFGMNLSGFEFDMSTGQMKAMPVDTVKHLIKWVQNAIETATNEKYFNSVLWLSKLMKLFVKSKIEKILILMDSIKALEIEPAVTLNTLVEKLSSIGLSFNEDPNISKIDEKITELFVQKHLVTTKLYSAIEDKIMFLSGYDPQLLNLALNELGLNYDHH